MKKALLLTSSLLLLTSLSAAPAKGPVYETVAEGYPAWAGVTDANFVYGRHLCPSDLRQKLTIVCFLDAEKYAAQFKEIYPAVRNCNPTMSTHATTAETMVVPRERICLVVLVGKCDATEVVSYLNKSAQDFSGCAWFVYSNVTGSMVPDHGGKFPFYCVFGPEPGDPLASGAVDADASKKLMRLMQDPKYKGENWKPYYGTVEEPKYMKGFAKTLASGKPLEPLTAACQKGIASTDPEKAKECQILFDALEQTRSDYLFDVLSFARTCPTRAFYEAQIMMKQWPKSKKALKAQVDKIRSIPDMPNLCKMFEQLKKWGAEDFTCKNAAEAKKIEAELKKMKATCDGLVQKSTVALVQSAAAWISYEAENLAPQMASKVPVK